MRRKNILVLIAVISGIISLILLPIAINIATSDLPLWVKDNQNWAWPAIVIFAFLSVILTKISVSLTDENNQKPSISELNEINIKVTNAVQIANHNLILTGDQGNWAIMLNDWKRYAETLITIYRKYQKRKDKKSRRFTETSLNLLERLTISVKRYFRFFNRRNDFIEIAKASYSISYQRERWIYAAELAYEIGCMYHETGKDEESKEWAEVLGTCLEKKGFCGFWGKVYNDNEAENASVFIVPTDEGEKENFFQALMWAAKLYDLKGLHTSNDAEEQTYLNKAYERAHKLPDQTLYAWVEIHIGDMEDRKGKLTAIKRYEDALKVDNIVNIPDNLEPAKLNDIIQLKLTCYSKLGRLAFIDRETSSQQAIDWYEKQLNLAEKYGRHDFAVLAHERLATIYFQGSPQDLQKSSQHVIAAWNNNQEFYKAGSEVIEPQNLVNLIIDVMKSSIAENSQADIASI